MNVSILKMVVAIIGLVLLLCVGGVIILLAQGKTVPNEFWTIIVSGFTGLLGLLAPSKEVVRTPDEGGA